METAPNVFQFKDDGERVIIELLDQQHLATGLRNFDSSAFLTKCRREVDQHIQDRNFKFLVFELKWVKATPSSFIGLLLSLRREGLTIELLNLSANLRHKLHMLNVAQLFTIHEL